MNYRVALTRLKSEWSNGSSWSSILRVGLFFDDVISSLFGSQVEASGETFVGLVLEGFFDPVGEPSVADEGEVSRVSLHAKRRHAFEHLGRSQQRVVLLFAFFRGQVSSNPGALAWRR